MDEDDGEEDEDDDAGLELNPRYGSFSVHPVGKAIVDAAQKVNCTNAKVTDGTFLEEPGSGAVATVDNKKILKDRRLNETAVLGVPVKATIKEEKFIKKLAEIQAQHVKAQAQGMELPPIDEDLIWEEVCSGQKKNRVYGKGAFFSRFIKSRTTSANSVSGRASTNQNSVPDLREQIHNLNEELFQRVTQQTDERISKLLDARLAPLEKTQKKLEKLERAIGKAKKEKLKQKRWNEAYVSYYKKVRASSSSTTAPPPPPPLPPPPSISSDEDYDDDGDEDDTEDYS
nr:uncharacterized protein LOC112702487 [Arachis hypogaea]